MEGCPKDLGSPYFQIVMGTPAMSFMCNMKKTLWVTGKTPTMDSSLCMLKVLVVMIEIGFYISMLVKKFRNWKTDTYRY